VYREAMTALLEKAIKKASALPEKEQEAIGALILEEIADIHAYDALQERAHSEIVAGQFSTLTTYRSRRRRKVKRNIRSSCPNRFRRNSIGCRMKLPIGSSPGCPLWKPTLARRT
jgi:hypothetical protein